MTCLKAIQVASEHSSPLNICISLPKEKISLDEAVSHTKSLALYVRHLAMEYRVPVILHSQHCSKRLPWLEGLISLDEDYYRKHGVPLFSSHGIDLSTDPYWEENLAIYAKYFADRFVKIDLWLEMSLGYSPRIHQQIVDAHSRLSRIGKFFSIKAEVENISDKASSLFVVRRSTHGVTFVGRVKSAPQSTPN